METPRKTKQAVISALSAALLVGCQGYEETSLEMNPPNDGGSTLAPFSSISTYAPPTPLSPIEATATENPPFNVVDFWRQRGLQLNVKPDGSIEPSIFIVPGATAPLYIPSRMPKEITIDPRYPGVDYVDGTRVGFTVQDPETKYSRYLIFDISATNERIEFIQTLIDDITTRGRFTISPGAQIAIRTGLAAELQDAGLDEYIDLVDRALVEELNRIGHPDVIDYLKFLSRIKSYYPSMLVGIEDNRSLIIHTQFANEPISIHVEPYVPIETIPDLANLITSHQMELIAAITWDEIGNSGAYPTIYDQTKPSAVILLGPDERYMVAYIKFDRETQTFLIVDPSQVNQYFRQFVENLLEQNIHSSQPHRHPTRAELARDERHKGLSRYYGALQMGYTT